MLNAIKGYLYLAVGFVILAVIGAVTYGLYKVHQNYEIAKETRIDTAVEKTATDVIIKQDVAVAKINKAGTESAANLQDILKDATAESSERSQLAAPIEGNATPHKAATVAPAAVVNRPTTNSTSKATPAPVVKGHSDTTTRTIDELWNNYCTLFPAESSCNRQTLEPGGVRASTTTGQRGQLAKD